MRSLLLLSLSPSLLVGSPACGGQNVASDTATLDFDTESSATPSAETSDATGAEEEDDDTAAGPCESDEDCGPMSLCVEGECQLDCGSAEMILCASSVGVVWVVDRSSSMGEANWDHDGDPGMPLLSRWERAHPFIAETSQFYDSEVSYGLTLMPSADTCPADDPDCYAASACEMPDALALAPTEIGGDSVTALLDLLPPEAAGPAELSGGSPLALSIEKAQAELLENADGSLLDLA